MYVYMCIYMYIYYICVCIYIHINMYIYYVNIYTCMYKVLSTPNRIPTKPHLLMPLKFAAWFLTADLIYLSRVWN